MTHLRSHLGRHMGRTPTSPEEMDAMRAAAWHKEGVIVLRPEDVACEWTRRAIQAWAEQRYGKRQERR